MDGASRGSVFLSTLVPAGPPYRPKVDYFRVKSMIQLVCQLVPSSQE